MSDTRKRFTPAEDARIKTLAARGACARAIATELDRSYWSIKAHARFLRVEIQREGRRETADGGSSYLSDYAVDWRAMTWDRLAWTYGSDQADRIQSGKDPNTQMDLGRWRSLGRRSAA